jgi:hypothetical protein
VIYNFDQWFIRESENNSSVYMFSPINNKEYKIMDLDLQKSDTFLISKDNIDTLIVDSTYIKDNRKHIQFNFTFNFAGGEEKFEFIEGVGTNFGLFYYGMNPTEIATRFYLLCAHKDNELTYSNTNLYYAGRCNIFWTNAKNRSIQKIRVFPNPSFGKVMIISEENVNESVEINIYNSNGSLIQSLNKSYLPQSVNMEAYPKGLYILIIKTDSEILQLKFTLAQ